MLLHSTERAVLKAEGKDPDQAMHDGVLRRVWNYFTRTEVTPTKIEGTIEAAKITAELKTRPTLREQVRDAITNSLTSFLDESDKALLELEERAKKLGFNGLVVLFDSLEKNRGVPSNWHEVLGALEKLFGGGAPYLHLPVHALYTVPPEIAVRLKLLDCYLPMIKVRTRAGAENEEGIAAARTLVTKRVPEKQLEGLLGPEWDRRLDRLVLETGGYPRDLMRLMQAVIEEESIDDEAAFDRLLRRFGQSHRSLVVGTAGAIEWLRLVQEKKDLYRENDAQMECAVIALRDNLVLTYLNDEQWFGLHPVLLRMREFVEKD